MCSGGYAGSGRALRLDPCGLPVRFSASDPAADGRVRDVELHRERIVVRRSLHGMRMALNLPVAAFAGISLRLESDQDGDVLAVVLEHTDPSLTLPLFLTAHADEAVAEWRAWSEVLNVPLLLAGQGEGTANARLGQIGQIHIERPRPRRRRRSTLKNRRPAILLRRGSGKVTRRARVHRGEREIIARN